MSANTCYSVLVVDDEPSLRLALRAHLQRAHWHVEVAAGVQSALETLRREAFDLVLCDVRMGDGTGFDVMRAASDAPSRPAFLFLTAHATVPEAVQAMRDGAVDYLTKPVCFDQLQQAALRVVRSRISREADQLNQAESGKRPGQGTEAPLAVRPPRDPWQRSSIVGHSRALLAELDRARAAALMGADALIQAESGTGKELLARFLHENSRRSEGPFIAVNCSALPETLLESELFGHARGAFTGAAAARPGKFELAHGGTLLLDEIGDMPLNLQPKLLRALQERVVERLGDSRPVRTDIRVIAATNVGLEEMVNRGLFRSDLYFRLNVIPLTLPPLRERPEDLGLLAEHFAEVFAARMERPVPRLHMSFLHRLQGYPWPGNVRELANLMQRVLSLTSSLEVTARDFDREHRPVARMLAPTTVTVMPMPRLTPAPQLHEADPLSMEQVERSHLEQTLEQVGGNRTRAAELLGISVRTMRNKIRQYDLPPRRYA